MDKKGFKKLLGEALTKIEGMRPIPPNDDLNDSSWKKVDKHIKRILNFLVEDEVPKPIDVLYQVTWDMAMVNFAVPVQTLAWRTLDTWLLIYESRRIRGIIASKESDLLTQPRHPVYIPPSVDERMYSEKSPRGALKAITEELDKRGLINRRREED